MKLILVRHGQTIENASGIMQGQSPELGRLTDLGIQQAEKLARRLSDEPFDVIFASDLERARRTAEIVAQFHEGVPFHITPLLRERDYGVLTGLPKKMLFEEIGMAGLTEVSLRPENGENYHDVKVRAREFLDALVEKYMGQHVLMVAHGGYNRAFLSNALNVPLDEMFGVSQGNTCMNIVEFDEYGIGKEVVVDCTKHLD